MGIRRKVSAIIDHVYCAMCGQAIYAPVSLTDAEKKEIENSGKSIQKQVMCPGCGYKTEIVIKKNNISFKKADI